MTDKPIPNAADETQVKDRKRNAKNAAELQRSDLVTLLKLPEFRRYVWRHWNETCGFPLRSAANPNGSQQSLNIGMQDVARVMWAEIEAADPLVIPQMMVETWEAQQK